MAEARSDIDVRIIRDTCVLEAKYMLKPSSSWFLPSYSPDSWSRTAYQVKRAMRGIGHVLFSTKSKTLNRCDSG